MKTTYMGEQHYANMYFNEALAGLIGLSIRAPVPQPAVLRMSLDQASELRAIALEEAERRPATDADRLVFASQYVRTDGVISGTGEGCDPAEAAAIVVLDALTWNQDEAQGHLMTIHTEIGFRFCAIDHEVAFTVADPELSPDRRVAEPFHELRSHATDEQLRAVIDRAQALGVSGYRALLDQIPDEWFVGVPAREEMAAKLVQRAENLRQLV